MVELISVMVVAYNSESTIIETLNSVRKQSYKNIELIVTDDCSTDNTRRLCEIWCEQHTGRFSSIKSEWGTENAGIVGNINKGLLHCEGNWIKIIAADDLLLRDCIKDNVNYIRACENMPKIVFSKYLYYRNNKILDYYYFARRFFELNAARQYIGLLREIGVNAPTCFIDLNYLKSLGGFDYRFPLLEDAPLYLELSKNGEKLYAFEKATVLYRIHSNNTSLGSSHRFINVGYWRSRKDFFDKVLSKALLERRMYLSWWSRYLHIYIQGRIIDKGNKRSNYSLFLRLLRCCDIKFLVAFWGKKNKHLNKEKITYDFSD